MSVITKDLGAATAYGYAVEKGYTGTEEEFAELMASYATVGQTVVDAKDAAVAAKTVAQTAATTATNKASEATTAAQTATTKAGEASTSASTATSAKDTAVSASQTATSKATEATTAASTATTAASTATTAKDDAVSAKTAAQTAQTDAETARDAVQSSAAQIATNASDITALKEDLTTSFNYVNEELGGTVVSGSYIKVDGSTGTDSVMRYMSVPVEAHGNYKITGSAWYAIKPYVFIANDSTIEYPTIPNPGGTVTQYTDMEFSPQKAGTLYVNWHKNNSYGLTQTIIGKLKETSAPSDILESVEFTKLSSTLTNYKKLNGTSGVVSDTNNASSNVTSPISVVGGKTYIINTQNYYSNGLYAFYDADMNFITGRASNAGGTMTLMEFEKVVAPANAEYLIVGLWSQTIFSNVYVAEGSERSIFPSKRWNGLKWACVGDSLTGSSIHDFRHYFNFVKERTGISLEIMGVGGSGYARGSASNNAFYQRVSALPIDTDVVTIFGSFNDLNVDLPLGTADDSTTDTIGGCINTTISNIIAVIPTANIGIVAPCPWGTTRPSTSGNAFDYVELLKAVAEKWSIPFLDLWRQSGMRPWDANFAAEAYPSGDTVHPNEIGHAILAPKFKTFLESLLM